MNAIDKPRTFCLGRCKDRTDFSTFQRRPGRGARFLTSEQRAKFEELLFRYNRDLAELKGGCEGCIKTTRRHIHALLGALQTDFSRRQLSFKL